MSRYIGVLYKLKSIVPLSVRLMIYNSFIQSHLNYCSLLWGTSAKSKIDSLFSTQKKAIRAVTPGHVNYFYKDGSCPSHTKPYFTNLQILTVHNIILKNCITFFNTKYHFPETLPSSIHDIIPHNSPSHLLTPEQCSDWYEKYNNHPFNKTIFFKGPLLYTDIINSNPNLNLPCTSKASFKQQAKSYILGIQAAGDSFEWETNNFKLLNLTGLRRSNRIKEQTGQHN